MSKPAAYRLKRDRFDHKAGTSVYSINGSDYGCANMDSRETGVEHTSVTLNPDGDYPSFTVPKHDLEPIAATTTDTDTDDFPLGKACDLSGDGTCEACQ